MSGAGLSCRQAPLRRWNPLPCRSSALSPIVTATTTICTKLSGWSRGFRADPSQSIVLLHARVLDECIERVDIGHGRTVRGFVDRHAH